MVFLVPSSNGALMMTQDQLEALVDELGLVSVVSLLATICHDKAQQILRLKGKGATLYTAWKANAFLLRQLMIRLQPTVTREPGLDATTD
jgi:hypothetical protein